MVHLYFYTNIIPCCLLPEGIPTDILCAFLVSHMSDTCFVCHVTSSPVYISGVVRIVKLLNVQFSPFYVYVM
jgi:hypothetical protein